MLMFIIIIRIWKLVHVMKEKSPESLAGRFSHWGFQRSALGRLDLPSPLPCNTFTWWGWRWWGWWWWQLWGNILRPLETPLHDNEDDDDDDVDDVVDDSDEIISSTLQHLYMMMMMRMRMMILVLIINTLHFFLLMITSLMMTKIRRRQRKRRGGSDLVLPTCFWNWGGGSV